MTKTIRQNSKMIKKNNIVAEAGLSPDQMMAQFAKRRDAENAKAAEEASAKKQQSIKQIWIKSLDLDKDVADLQITYADGKVEDTEFDISTTGSAKSNGKDIDYHQNGTRYYAVAGERYKQQDSLYRDLEANLKKGRGKPGCLPRGLDVTDEDVRVSMIKVAFNDWRIKWLYGKDKKSEPWFAFSRPEEQETAYAAAKKIKSPSKWYDKVDPRGETVYQNGGTRIYRMNEDDESEGSDETSDEEDVAQTLPTRFVFLKITLKK